MEALSTYIGPSSGVKLSDRRVPLRRELVGFVRLAMVLAILTRPREYQRIQMEI